MDCGSASKLETNLEFPCDPPVAGVRPKIWLGYHSDLVAFPRNASGKIITAVTLKTGAKLKSIEGFKLSNAPSLGTNNTAYRNFITHNIQIAIFDKGEQGRLAVDTLVRAEDLFFIYREKATTGNFIIMGANAGMSFQNMTSAENDENGGAFILDFSAGQEVVTPEILKHSTDTELYLNGITFVPAEPA